MSRPLVLAVLTAIWFSPFRGVAAEPSVQLQAGDRIVFLGDSITQAGAEANGYVTKTMLKVLAPQ